MHLLLIAAALTALVSAALADARDDAAAAVCSAEYPVGSQNYERCLYILGHGRHPEMVDPDAADDRQRDSEREHHQRMQALEQKLDDIRRERQFWDAIRDRLNRPLPQPRHCEWRLWGGVWHQDCY